MKFQTVLGLWGLEGVLQVVDWSTWWMKILFVDLDTKDVKANKPLLPRRRVVYNSIQLINILSDLITTVKLTCRSYTAFSSLNVSAWDPSLQNVHPFRQMWRRCSRNVRFETQPCNNICCLTCRAIVSENVFFGRQTFWISVRLPIILPDIFVFYSLFSDVYQINVSQITAYSRYRWSCCLRYRSEAP